MAMQLNWKTCGDNRHWCNLRKLKLDNNNDKGVYMIWHTGDPSRVVRVGQGNIAERLTDHRNNNEILTYGELLVTWAVVPSKSDRDGIERHLADEWRPLVGDAFPNTVPIAVNSPFG